MSLSVIHVSMQTAVHEVAHVTSVHAVSVSALLLCAFVLMTFCHMHHGGAQAQINDINLQAASGKIPPSWSPERDRQYSFRQYTQDLGLWVASTDVDPARIGPMVALRLGGSAKIIAREMDTNSLVNGALVPDPGGAMVWDAQQQMQVPLIVAITGLEVLLKQLRRRYAPLEQEVQIGTISDMFHFRRWQSEGTDEVIARYDLVMHRAEQDGGVQINEPIRAWMLLSALGVPRDKWITLLAPTQGALPNNQQQYNAFVQYLRRTGHLHEHQTNKTLQVPYFAVETDSQQAYWNTQPHTFTAPTIPYSDEQLYGQWSEDGEEEQDSSGWSNDEEEVDNSDIANMTVNNAGEHLYLEYRAHKRKFRHFTKHPKRFGGKGFRRSGKGKGKGKGKRLFFQDHEGAWQSYEDEAESEQAYAFGKGGKGKGGKRRGNPVGPDGKVMTCSECGSEEHFVRFCPRAKGKGGGKGKGKGPNIPAPAPGYHAHWSSSSSGMPGPSSQGNYLLGATVTQPLLQLTNCIEYADGSVEELGLDQHELATFLAQVPEVPKPKRQVRQPNPQPFPKNMPRFFNFFVQIVQSYVQFSNDAAYHTSVRLASGAESLLVDCGAVTNMMGDCIAQRIEQAGKQAGQGSSWTDIPVISVEGVGAHASEVSKKCTLPICLSDGQSGNFTAIVQTPNSELPALMGLTTLESHKAIIDTANRRLIFPGEGGCKFVLSPGSRVYKLEKAKSGHLMLPCCEWNTQKSQKPNNKLTNL